MATGEVDFFRIRWSLIRNVATALELARSARGILGANGVTAEYPVMRHMCNLEFIPTKAQMRSTR